MNKLLVVGLGNIGTVYGWALAQAGVEVTHVVRPGWTERYAKGIRLDVLDLRSDPPTEMRTIYEPSVVEDVGPSDAFDLVMVPTKQYQQLKALRQFAPRVGPSARFLMFCANWEGTEAIDAIVPRDRYVWGYAAASGGPDAEGVAVVSLRPDYRIGPMAGTDPALLKQVVDLFARARLTADCKPDMLEWLWVHHATNAALIGSTLWAGGLEAFIKDAQAQALMPAAAREAIEVLRHRGVAVDRYPDAMIYLEKSDAELISLVLSTFVDSATGQRMMRGGHFKSAPDEMKRFYFDVLETAEALRVAVPTLASMHDRIEEYGNGAQ